MIDRRIVACARIGLFAVLSMLPVAAPADEPRTVGLLAMGSNPIPNIPSWSRFYARMRELGWREGENVRFVPGFAAGDIAQADAIMREFVRTRVSLVVVTGAQEALAAKRATTSIPVVMLHVSDPDELGLVASLAHPGGNFTGQSWRAPGTAGKQVELIAQMGPGIRHIEYGQGQSSVKASEAEIRAAAGALGLAFSWSELPLGGDFDAWVAQRKRQKVDAAVFVLDSLTFPPNRRNALAFALLKHKVPAICAASEYVEAGCLMSYGSVFVEHYARGAEIADRILRGARPADLPVEQPTKFELVVNMKTARALGLKVPQAVLLRADRVIE